ncbi:DUF397 domain-containing protein [Micromonospora sp. LOL_025]|uniref:DUF397 domain-containing protein n=1 Tax=Micromonospora sp. LOL_025 TaxID=3345413 RepID=UPI003A879BA5
MSTTQYAWRRSSRSDDGNCVEVAVDDAVLIRDSKNPDGPVLRFAPRRWRSFISAIRASESVLDAPD